MKKGRVDGAKVLAGDFADGITDGIKTWGPYVWWDLFTGKNTDGITDGFEMPDPYGWHDRCNVKNTDEITEGFEKQVFAVTCRFPVRITDGVIRSVRPSEKVNIWPLFRHSPPPFLLLLPNPKSPHLQITSPPLTPKQNLPHLSTTRCISWSFVVTTSVFWFTDGFYQFL